MKCARCNCDTDEGPALCGWCECDDRNAARRSSLAASDCSALGLPLNAKDWTVEDWRDLHAAIKGAVEKIAKRHACPGKWVTTHDGYTEPKWVPQTAEVSDSGPETPTISGQTAAPAVRLH